MPAPDSDDAGLPLAHLPPEKKASRSGSFGAVATQYERFRPGPPEASVDWLLPAHVGTVVDLGAGTGALTRLLIGRADEVVAVEPDARMRSVLADRVPGATAVDGRGEALPLGDSSAVAILASSSWHWMDLAPTLREVDRVLQPDGFLGTLWSGPDPEGPFMNQARALLAERASGGDRPTSGAAGSEKPTRDVTGLILGDVLRPMSTLELPADGPLAQPEHRTFRWDVPLDADELMGLLGTLSWVITMDEEARAHLMADARRLLAELLGVEGDITVDVAFRCEAWRAWRAH